MRHIEATNCRATIYRCVGVVFAGGSVFCFVKQTRLIWQGGGDERAGFAPALARNADFRPLNYFPLSLWSWQDTVKVVWSDRVTIISEHDQQISSPSLTMNLPSVIALKNMCRKRVTRHSPL